MPRNNLIVKINLRKKLLRVRNKKEISVIFYEIKGKSLFICRFVVI